jgi:hypothetical protein
VDLILLSAIMEQCHAHEDDFAQEVEENMWDFNESLRPDVEEDEEGASAEARKEAAE